MANDLYALGRGFVEASRLGCQHYLWNETLGYLVKWDIVTTNIINTLKLHSLWLLDLAKTLPPSTQLDGFDISDSGYPPREWLPSHVSMQILNAFEDPPQTLWGKYDIVHLRLFLIVVNENNVAPLLDHCMKLLKPGGFIQWDEYDLPAQTVITSEPSVPTEHIDKLCEFMKAVKPFEWVAKLPQSFEAYGLRQVTVSRSTDINWHTRMWMGIELLTLEEYARNFLDVKGSPGSGDDLRQLVKAVQAEVQQGATLRRILQVVVGQKAA